VGHGPEAQAALEARLLADKRVQGLFAEVTRAITAVRGEGEEAMVRKAREVLHRGTHRVHKHLGTIAAVASAAPMLGLAGTVGGVMVTFQVITLYGIGNPAMMAGGIAEALMVTEAALVVALPLMILHDRLATRADQIESECVAGATRLIRAFAPGRDTLPLSLPHEDQMGNHGSAVRI
jgi:biopolymer transport protein ExbB/TolQ